MMFGAPGRFETILKVMFRAMTMTRATPARGRVRRYHGYDASFALHQVLPWGLGVHRGP